MIAVLFWRKQQQAQTAFVAAEKCIVQWTVLLVLKKAAASTDSRCSSMVYSAQARQWNLDAKTGSKLSAADMPGHTFFMTDQVTCIRLSHGEGHLITVNLQMQYCT